MGRPLIDYGTSVAATPKVVSAPPKPRPVVVGAKKVLAKSPAAKAPAKVTATAPAKVTTRTVIGQDIAKPGAALQPVPNPAQVVKPAAITRTVVGQDVYKPGARLQPVPNPAQPVKAAAPTSTILPKPMIPGHEAAPAKPAYLATAQPKAKAAIKAPARVIARAPAVHAPAGTAKAGIGASMPASTASSSSGPASPAYSSPSPGNVTGSGGLLSNILPILLIAGAALALWYLYTHRKGK